MVSSDASVNNLNQPFIAIATSKRKKKLILKNEDKHPLLYPILPIGSLLSMGGKY